MDIDARLNELMLTLPEAPKPVAAYVPCVRSGNLVYVSGQLPMRKGKLMAEGKVPSVVGVDTAKDACGQCVLNALAILKNEINGDWSKFVRVVRVGAFVQSDDTFVEQSSVANGASELLVKIFGEAGKHARAAVGTNALPLGTAVEVEFIFEVK